MEASIVNRESFEVVGYQYEANLKEIEEQQLGKKTLERLKSNAEHIKNKVGDEIYLIQLYEPKPTFNANVDRFIQIIGYKVSGAADIPEGMVSHTVPESSYVTATHRGLESELYHTYHFLYGEWPKENPYVTANYDFEIWDERYKPTEETNEIDVYVAVKRK